MDQWWNVQILISGSTFPSAVHLPVTRTVWPCVVTASCVIKVDREGKEEGWRERNSSRICVEERGRNIKNQRERDEGTGTRWHFSWYSVRPIGAVNPQQRAETDSWWLRGGGWRCTHPPPVCDETEANMTVVLCLSSERKTASNKHQHTRLMPTNTHSMFFARRHSASRGEWRRRKIRSRNE